MEDDEGAVAMGVEVCVVYLSFVLALERGQPCDWVSWGGGKICEEWLPDQLKEKKYRGE